MEDNTGFFWDKKINAEEARKVLGNEHDPRFIEFVSLLLARSNEPRTVFGDYLSKEAFVKNWAKIKRRMRENKWNDARIIFWNEIYRAVRKREDFQGISQSKERPLRVDPDMKVLCDQIREVRQKSGLTQTALAEKTGLSQQSISFVEQGYVNISLGTLKKIVDALNLKIVLIES